MSAAAKKTRKPSPAGASLSDFSTQRRNANKHTPRGLGLLANSIGQDGWIGAMTVAADGETFDGSARLEVLADAMPSAEPIVVDSDGTRPVIVRRTDIASTDDPRAKRLGLGANRIAQVDLDWDADALAALAGEIDLSAFWNKDELADIMKGMGGNDAEDPGADISRADELQAKWGTALGKLWKIGKHRLLVGDCTVAENVARLMGGDKAQLVATDPPYGVSYTGKTKSALTIENDGRDTLFGLLHAWLVVAKQFMNDGAAFYIAAPAGPQSLEFSSAIVKAGLNWRQTLVWLKDAMVLGHSDYHYKHEIVYYGSNGRKAKFYGGRKNVSVISDGPSQPFRELEEGVFQVQVGSEVYIIRGQNIEIEAVWPDVVIVPRPKASRLYPTMKPVELFEKFVTNSTQAGEVVYEPFCGSGTTLVACEKLGRIGRGMELSAAYAAVTLERLSGLGLSPELVS